MRSRLFTTVFDDPEAEHAKKFVRHLREVLQLTEADRKVCLDALPRLRLLQTDTQRRSYVDTLASSHGIAQHKAVHALSVADFFADSFLNDAVPAGDHQFWADDAQELGWLDDQSRPAFEAFLNRLTSMREDLKSQRQQQRAEGGVLPSFQSMGCTVEVRPISATIFRWGQPIEQYQPQILGIVTIASVHIGVDEGPVKDFYFQADVADIDNIISSLMAAKKEMAALRDFLRLDDSGNVKNDE